MNEIPENIDGVSDGGLPPRTCSTLYGVDMEKVQAALKKIGNKARAPGTYLDMKKALKVGTELVGSSLIANGPRRAVPKDTGKRTHTTKIAKGCSGFSHPNFHP